MFLLLILAVLASEKKKYSTEDDPKNEQKIVNHDVTPILVKIEEDEYYAKINKKYRLFGVYYNKPCSMWHVTRWSTNENKVVSYGYYADVETAAHASDTLARRLMENGRQKLKLNFPNDYAEVHPEEKSSKFIGVSYRKDRSNWCAYRKSKYEGNVSIGCYDDEETAAHASDTLARKLMKSGEQKLKLNFPDDYTEVYTKEKQTSSQYFGVRYRYRKKTSNWNSRRWSKSDKKYVHNGCYDDEETAARASDTLARKLMDSGEEGHKLNFPDDPTEQNDKRKRKRSAYLEFEQL